MMISSQHLCFNYIPMNRNYEKSGTITDTLFGIDISEENNNRVVSGGGEAY